MAHRDLDDIVTKTEHARPVHPFRALIENHFFVDGFVDKGGMSLILMDGLILVPIIMFAFFYPVQVLLSVGAFLLLIAIGYEAIVIWRKKYSVRH